MDARVAGEARPADFKFIGGDTGLDFVNTVGGWVSNSNKLRAGYRRRGSGDERDRIVRDKLTDYVDLVMWSKRAGLLTEKESRLLLKASKHRLHAAEAVFRRALKLRTVMYRLFWSSINNVSPLPGDIERLNQEVLVARSHEKLIRSRSRFGWSWHAKDPALDRMLWPLAIHAVELLTSANLSRVRQCGGVECGWLFLDTSRNRSRHWCDMKDCGNLAKVRRFRSRLAVGSMQ